MSKCNNCCKCFEQADGTIIKRSDNNLVTGGFDYTLPDLSVTSAAPAGFSSANEVDCSKFDMATSPPEHLEILEEVCNGSQTGILVQVEQAADGTKIYTNLSTGGTYSLPAGCELHTSEDTDYNEHTYFVCQAGIDVKVTVIYKDGDITDVISTTTTDLAGNAVVLTEAAVAGTCAAQLHPDKENACFRDPASADNPMVTGYIQYMTNVSTQATTTKWFDDADVELDKAVYKKVKCC